MSNFSLCTIVSVATLNACRPDALSGPGSAFKADKNGHIDRDLSELVSSLFEKGYDSALGGSMVLVRLDEFQQDPSDSFQAVVDWIEAGANLAGDTLTIQVEGVGEDGEPHRRKIGIKLSDVLEMVHEIYGQGEAVEYFPASGNRRTLGLPFAAAALKAAGEDYSHLLEIPARIETYGGSKAALIVAGSAFNEDDKIGKRNLSTQDKFLTGFAAFDQGAKQQDMRKAFKPGVGQRVWRACKVDQFWPEFGLRDLVISGDLNIGGKEELQKLIRLTEISASGAKLVGDRAQRERAKAVAEDAAKLWSDIRKGQVAKRKKAASAKDLDEMAGRTKVNLIQQVLEAAADNELAALAPLNEHAADINKAVEQIQAGEKLSPALYLIDLTTGETTNQVVTQEMVEQMQRQIDDLLKAQAKPARKSKAKAKS